MACLGQRGLTQLNLWVVTFYYHKIKYENDAYYWTFG